MTEQIKANPAKRFFVEMLTRDIDLDDAILDLLDNSLDGLLRIIKTDIKQYKDYKVEINLSEDKFEIKDNCGGIPTQVALDYAFRMGRPNEHDDDIPTIGMYGIGMKRSVFKMGTDIKITSNNDERCFQVEIPKSWLQDDNNWNLSMKDCEESLSYKGTSIVVQDLHIGISKLYSNESSFVARLIDKIAIHYAFVLKQGLTILINGELVKGKEISLLVDDGNIEPFIYKENIDGLEVEIICGLADAPPSLEEDSQSAETTKVNRVDAGWSVICNDRVVLYADRSRLTGWGDGLPMFHNQFNTLVGIVHFKSNKAFRLPVTTTKRGVDASSDDFLRIRREMIKGMRIFVNYTNKWKNQRDKERETVLFNTKHKTLDSLMNSEVLKEKMKKSTTEPRATVYRPKLPEPPKEDDGIKMIKYKQHKDEIEKIAEEYFENKNLSPSDVGKKCFEEILAKANKG